MTPAIDHRRLSKSLRTFLDKFIEQFFIPHLLVHFSGVSKREVQFIYNELQ